jgi:hypothetical protein
MLVTHVPIVLPHPAPKSPRSPGVHVSTLIKGIAQETGFLPPDDLDELGLVNLLSKTGEAWWETLDHVAKLRISLGLAWEEWYIPQLEAMGVVDHPGEMEVEGIYMTHDGESMDRIVRGRLEPVIHEVKATYKSINTVGLDLATQWMWLTQTKAYCKGAGATRAYLHVLFMCGDYKMPIRPRLGPIDGQMTCYCIDYTPEEIQESWTLLRDYRDERLS